MKSRKSRNFWERLNWYYIVDYANQSPKDAPDVRRSAFREVFLRTMRWIGGTEDDIVVCADLRGLLEARGIQFDGIDDPDVESALDSLADQYRSGLQRVLTWLSAPTRHADLAVHAAKFLDAHGTAIVMHVGYDGYEHEDDMLLAISRPDFLVSVIAPTCKFILDRIERHDTQGEPLRDVIPIGRCDREGCGRFRMIRTHRKSKHFFCSDRCKALFHQARKTNKEKAAFMRDYRAKKKLLRRRSKIKRV